jgi:hypothetical protein
MVAWVIVPQDKGATAVLIRPGEYLCDLKWRLPDQMAREFCTVDAGTWGVRIGEELSKFFDELDKDTMLGVRFNRHLEPKPSIKILGGEFVMSIWLFDKVGLILEKAP